VLVGKTVALIQVVNQRAFRSAAAARYCGIDEDTLHKYTKNGDIVARNMNGRRAYLLDDLDKFLEGLPLWENSGRSTPASASSKKEKQHV
jgi:hypothetical protein